MGSPRSGCRGREVTALTIACLTVLALYLGSRWINASAENAELRARIAALKRELARRRS
jgi:hypothetical protein